MRKIVAIGLLAGGVGASPLFTSAARAVAVEPWFGAPIPASGEKPIPDCGMTAARIFDAPISGLERIGSMAIPTTADLPESANASIGFECLDRGLFDPDRCYDPLAAVGVKWARCQTMWSRCEKQKGVYDFTVLDGVVDNLTRRGIRPWFCVSFGNTLYMTNCYTGAAVGCVPTLYGDECRAAWCAYVRALARRYKGKVTHWEIWNEPNLKHFWQPSKPNAIDYLELVKLTGGIIREEIPDAKIGGTTSMPAIQEWETAFFEAGGAALIDFWCGHGYAPSPESIRPKWRIATCDSIDYVTVLKEVRAFIDAHGGKHLEIWQGESGFASWFPENHQLWVPGICKEGWQSQANQAKWLLRRFITDRRAGIARSSFFQMADISRHYSMATVTKKHPAEHGIVNGWTYKPKMSYWAFGHYNALLATARHDESVAVSLTPAADAGAPTVATTFRTPDCAPLFVYYTAFDFSGNYTGTCYTARCDAKLTLPAALAPKDPVLVDMLRGGVYAVSSRMRTQKGGCVTFSGLPLVDYPLLVADRSQVKMKDRAGEASLEITPEYEIVVPDDRPDDVPKHLAAVARELAHDIEESTGMRLPVVSAKDARQKAKCIYIGEAFAEREGLLPKDRPLENFDYVVAERNGSVYLFGHDRTRFADPGRKAQWWRYCLLASGRAVVSFMENEMGVAFLAPGRAGRDVPKRKSIAVRKGVCRVRRESQIAGVSRELEMMYDLASGIYGLGTWRSHGGHLYPAAVPFAKYSKSHPEYFPMHGNARVKSNGVNALCISNPEVEQLLVDFIVAEMDDGADIVELGQNDGSSWCQCEKCQAFGGTAPSDWGEKFWIFHRRIAERVNALRPEKTVQIISYGPTAMPPRTFTEFPTNVMIELMNCRPAALSAWRNYRVERGFSNYVYHWGDYPSPGFTAKNSVASMAAAARKYREYGIKFVYRCGYGELFGTEGPAYYVFNKLLFDPFLDENEIFAQYVSRAYGPASKAMMKFHTLQDGRVEIYNALDAGIDGNRRVVPKHAADMLAAMYPPDVLDQLGNLLAAAERTEGLSAKQAMRLRLVRLEYDYLEKLIRPIHLYFGYLASPSVETFRPLADALESRASFLDSLGDGKGRVRGIEGWDRLHPFSPTGRFDRKRMATNGRLSARLDAPFAWDAKAMLAKGFLPGRTKAAAKAPRTDEEPSATDFEHGAWAAAKWNELNGLQLEKIANRTRFKAVAGTDALYIAVETTLPDDRKYEPTGHDSSCYLRDCIDFAIAPDMAGDRAYHFVFGPVENSSLDEARGLITDELDPKYGTYDGEWNGKWDYAPLRADGIWRTRVKIPYATLGVPRPAPGAKWRMNLGRLAEPDSTGGTPYAYCEFSSWSPNFESRSFSDLGAMGEVLFE